ncbi:50S ribosomal protein L3 [Desulfomicrobium orale]|uniref:Large ribosomal subunit protein uL3 n=1 Tax=Desulfomicrobium orale DSM 12838 TaxID=888061 RepID=A0A0X8JNH7_9BACT|nr:50S ribosomal protein L3 [Desulfomicrobium orale]AMD91842.1 50S ribosomal protein L3 [Desulfomicrobium orale DSM 12838]
MKNTLGLVGRKIGMTRIFGADGSVIPVTVIQAGPCPVVDKKVEARDGYAALQVGFEEIPAHRLTKPEQGHQQKANCGFYRMLKEFRLGSVEEYEVGQKLTVEMFAPGEKVRVTGTSKGRGFAGVMRRWNFGGAPATHGHEKVHRKPGSIGQCAWPSKVFKGKKLPGQLGNKTATMPNIEIVDVRPEDNVVLVRGQIPGPRQGIVILRKLK